MTEQRRVLAGLAGLLLMATLGAGGCRLSSLHVLIPDFDASSVDGVTIWQLDEATGQPVTAATLRFLDVGMEDFGTGPFELLDYEIVLPDGSVQPPLTTQVQRNPASADVDLLLFFVPAGPGWYRVSTYNEAGTSPLSAEQVYLM